MGLSRTVYEIFGDFSWKSQLYVDRVYTVLCKISRFLYLAHWLVIAYSCPLTVFGVTVTNLNEPPTPRASAASAIAWAPSLLGCHKQKQRGLRGYYVAGPPLLNERCTSLHRAPSLRNDLYCVKWDVKLYYTIPYHFWDIRLVSIHRVTQG